MIDDLDEFLRQLLIREMPIRNNEVDIAFDQPSREWSGRLNRPTLNVFLHDMRENNQLRRNEWEIMARSDGKLTKRRPHFRLDLHYMVTAWAAEPDDEHRLLTRVLMAFLRWPKLPLEDLPESLQDQPVPMPMRPAHHDQLRNPADIWSALDNEIRPAISLVITLAVNPYRLVTEPLVRTRELVVGHARDTLRMLLDERMEPDHLFLISGLVRGDGPRENLRLRLVERGVNVPVSPEGEFAVGHLLAGEYTLEVWSQQERIARRKITVPSPDYDMMT